MSKSYPEYLSRSVKIDIFAEPVIQDGEVVDVVLYDEHGGDVTSKHPQERKELVLEFQAAAVIEDENRLYDSYKDAKVFEIMEQVHERIRKGS